MPRNPNKTRCSVPGCRAWAIRGSSPPYCSPHRARAPQDAAARDQNLTPGSSAPSAGAPSVGAPPGNQNRLIHGFYATVLRPNELADLTAFAADDSLDAEIAVTRVALRRVLGMLLTGHTPDPNARPLGAQDYARYIALAFQGAGTISRILRARQDLAGDGDDPFTTFFDQVLDELSEEWGVQL